ncbi:MAG: glycosyltransferase [Alphaproteobacteria bacterium]|nr:glycosyltransferase [Alphaproteobacteria bacterium]
MTALLQWPLHNVAGIVFGFLPLGVWLYLIFGRELFWLFREREGTERPSAPHWPSVVAVVPARDEADVIARSLGSLIAQNYKGDFHVILVDDQSDDGTAIAARALGSARVTVLAGAPRPPGWTGKLWAMHQGVEAAKAHAPDYIWFTDADIAHAPDNLARLAGRAEAGGLVLTSQMAKLSARTMVEHFLIPAFVFFFAMLYPFGAVNDPRRKTAAAAGGCMLARQDALTAVGGIGAIRHNIIDDVSLAERMKRQGPVWLGLSTGAVSLRAYESLSEIRRMVARSAFAELDYSVLKLLGTLLGLVLVYLAPPATALFAWGPSQMAGWLACLLMVIALQPILRFYRLSPLWGFALPIIAAFYALFTLDSAWAYWCGRGGMWKGRAQAGARSEG